MAEICDITGEHRGHRGHIVDTGGSFLVKSRSKMVMLRKEFAAGGAALFAADKDTFSFKM